LILRLWYIIVPFYAFWLYFTISKEHKIFSLCWSLAISEAQIKMNWVYYSEEVFDNPLKKILNKKMKLTNTILTKENKTIELQGMIHISTSNFYQMQQQIIDKLEQTIIFYEGVKKKEELKNLNFNENQKIIEKFFLSLFNFLPQLANKIGFSFQKDALKYPKNAINADISFEELILKLDEVNYRPEKSLKMLEEIKDNDEIVKKIQKSLEKMLNGKFSILSKIFIKFFSFGKFASIVLHYRNKVAVDIIEKELEKNKIEKAFVHYGEAHISGIKKLLKERGWKIVKK